ncbi:MAG: AAA family ATPase, partial [Spirulinaceae cyanobacterium]
CFKSFELEPLGRINLLVGKNNTGKTSILEAINIFWDHEKENALEEVLQRRSEAQNIKYSLIKSIETSKMELGVLAEMKTKYVFAGKLVVPEIHFSVTGTTKQLTQILQVDISEDLKLDEDTRKLIAQVQGKDKFYVETTHLVKKKEDTSYIENINGQVIFSTESRFLIPTSIDLDLARDLYREIVLNPEEENLLDSLRILEPRIERIAADPSNESTSFYIKLKGEQHRVPLNTMGDGMWRMLSITLILVTAKGGVVLIDEIDTGLHYTAMVDMWRFIWKVAQRLDVQVFATTHNSDCWMSLATVAEEENTGEDGITIHRIEKGASRSIVFNGKQMAIAAERGIEVR